MPGGARGRLDGLTSNVPPLPLAAGPIGRLGIATRIITERIDSLQTVVRDRRCNIVPQAPNALLELWE